MIITYTLDNNIIFDKEISKKDISKLNIKVALITATLLFIPCVVNATVVPWYKRQLDQGGIYIFLKFFETIYADKTIESIKFIEQLPKEALKKILDAGYTIEEFLDWCIKNR